MAKTSRSWRIQRPEIPVVGPCYCARRVAQTRLPAGMPAFGLMIYGYTETYLLTH
jgi:hypothetical protein